MAAGEGADAGLFVFRTGPSLASAVVIACAFGSWWACGSDDSDE
jgi:hypothetical protein